MSGPAADRHRPPARLVLTPHDAELVARDWLAYMGFVDASVTLIGPDEGIDVVSADVVAQVKAVAEPVGRPVVQQIFGVASLERKQALLFTMEGVTRQARAWSDRAGVGLFRLDRAGGLLAENGVAEALLANADAPVTGWRAVQAELEQYQREGSPARIDSVYSISNGRQGFWAIEHDGQSGCRRTVDVVGSRTEYLESVEAAVEAVAADLRSLGVAFRDCRPQLTVGGETVRFFPRLSYRAEVESDEAAAVAGSVAPPPAEISSALRVTASDLYQALSGPKCDRRIYLQHRGVKGASASSFESLMIELGVAHEQGHRDDFDELVDLGDGPLGQRIVATTQALDAAEPVIYQAAFRSTATVVGCEIEVVGTPDFVLADPSGWIIRDTKVARRVTSTERPDIEAQLQLYGWLFEQVRAEAPVALEVVNGDGEIISFDYVGWPAIEKTVERVVACKTAAAEPPCRARTAHSSCPYFDRCWGEAIARSDVSTLPGVTEGLLVELGRIGVHSIPDLLDRLDVDDLANTSYQTGSRLRRVGSSAERLLRAAESITTGDPIWLAPPALPPDGPVAMLDLEGVPAVAGAEGLVYLWGVEMWGVDGGGYTPVFASRGPDAAEAGWFAFLDLVDHLFARFGRGLPFVHWAAYERTQLRQHIERFGDRDGLGQSVIENLVDLLEVTRNAVTLPVRSYSLKTIEQYVGFERSQTEFGGDWSIVVWQEAVATDDPAERQRLLEQLAIYNQEDCAATGVVYDWLRHSTSGW